MQAREYDLYLPLHHGSGAPVESAKLERVRERLVERFGGLTDFRQRHEGEWRVGGVVFTDEIVIWRVLATDAGSREFLRSLKRDLEVELEQDEVLIVERSVEKL